MNPTCDSRALLRVDVRDGTPRTTIDARGVDLETMLLERLADDQLRMPPYPAIALELQRLAERGRSTTGEIAAVISADAALVAAVLRRANAAVFSARGQVISLDIAIGRLGLQQIVEIAIAQSVGSAMNTLGPLRALRRDVWRRSLLSAAIASELAPARGVDRDAAFVAALLHDFGAVTVLVGLEDLGVELPVLSAVTWRRFVERLQAPFGRVFAQRWRLPEPIADAIEHWSQPRGYTGAHRTLVELIASAVAIIATLDSAPAEGVESLQHVEGLDRSEAERVQELVPRIADLMDGFEPRAPAGSATTPAASAVEAAAAPDVQWPIDVVATWKTTTMRACAIDPDAVVLVGAEPMALNWLVPVVLHAEPRVDMLANVAACTEEPDGTHRIVVRPFALAGAEKDAWFALVNRAREAALQPSPAQPGPQQPEPPPPSVPAPPAVTEANPRPVRVTGNGPVASGVTLQPTSRRWNPVAAVLVLGALTGIVLGIVLAI